MTRSRDSAASLVNVQKLAIIVIRNAANSIRPMIIARESGSARGVPMSRVVNISNKSL